MFRKEFGKANVTSLVERVSRFTVVLKTPDRRSKPVMAGLIESLSPLPVHARRSITFDRGTEFSAWQHLPRCLGVDLLAFHKGELKGLKIKRPLNFQPLAP
jgi:IS30 family transposase